MAKHKFSARLAARRAGGTLINRAKPLAIAAVAGGAGQAIGEFAGNNLEFVQKKWWGEPVMLGLGAVAIGSTKMKGKETLAAGLAGAAGYSAAFQYKLMKFQLGERKASPVRDVRDLEAKGKAKEKLLETKGYDDDAGMVETGDEPYSLAQTFDDVGDDDDAGMVQTAADYGNEGGGGGGGSDDADVESAYRMAMQGPGNPWGV